MRRFNLLYAHFVHKSECLRHKLEIVIIPCIRVILVFFLDFCYIDIHAFDGFLIKVPVTLVLEL